MIGGTTNPEVTDSVRQVVGDDEEVLLLDRLLRKLNLLFNILKVPIPKLYDIPAQIVLLYFVKRRQLPLLIPSIVKQFFNCNIVIILQVLSFEY